ncbi:MAG: hypothetical protein VR65_06270 [Desulfobulbaceae bacterium BRH_c16a]|nr:MAG: hypothetical protein VR65_25060 [Desulfobulbaceae bacterium BRH_c16a]KJS02243.1 MAG: hypothetical protein VR65_06270 [Desulfobulbaceae bacterium BRH_c16a]
MIQLAKDNTATPDAYSSGDGSDPVAVSFTLNGTGIPATITASPAADLFVWAEDDTGNIANYTSISVGITGADPGITWELSADGATGWAESIPLADLDVSVTHQAVQIFARATAVNDGSVETANYVTAKITINATENPA